MSPIPELGSLPDFVFKIQRLGEEVAGAKRITDDHFRSALCDIIRELPDSWQTNAKRICMGQACPVGTMIMEALGRDIEVNEDNIERIVILHPLMRVAVAIRSGELA